MNMFRKISGILLIALGALLGFPALFTTLSLIGQALRIRDGYSFGLFLGSLIFCLILYTIIFGLFYYGVKLLKKTPVKRSEAEIINQDLT